MLLLRGEPAVEATAGPDPIVTPVLTVVPTTVSGAAGCLTARGLELVRRTDRSIVVSGPGVKRAAIMVYPSEAAAARAATAGAAAGWKAVGNTRVRATGDTAAGHAVLIGCLAQPLQGKP
ncbi:MAG: hypothetical protein QM679_06255 [Patulibacter sp.]